MGTKVELSRKGALGTKKRSWRREKEVEMEEEEEASGTAGNSKFSSSCVARA